MQSILSTQFKTAPRVFQAARYRTSATSRSSMNARGGFSARKPMMQPGRPFFGNHFIRRPFSNGRRPDFAAYTSTRTAIWTIIGLNAAVFGAWQYAIVRKDRSLLRTLSNNFSTSIQNMRDGRYYTLLTSAFSHQGLAHFAFNMITFYAFGSIMSVVGLGGAHLVSLVIGSGVAGSTAWLYHQYTKSDTSVRPASALGASGVVMGAGAVATCLMPFAPMQMMFIPVNIPLWALMFVYAGLDTYYLNSSSTVGHAAHLGGILYGFVYYAIYLRRFGGVANMLRRSVRR